MAKRKAGRQPMAPEKKKQTKTLRYDPEIILFFEYLGQGKVSGTLCRITKRSKDYRDWQRSQK